MTQRYNLIHMEVRRKQPKCIVEVGTWNGERARNMLQMAPNARYYGFDLFQDATKETDRVEFNIKKHYFVEDVEQRLTGYDVYLIKGNTRETLKNFKPEFPIDFLWLDGGHSLETIRSDWENIKPHLAPDAWVFFDDYFEGPIDTTKIGCNEIVKDLKHEVIGPYDPVTGGGTTRIVRVYP